MNDQLAELRLRLGEVSDLRSALALLEWDQMVMMPPGRRRRPGGAARHRGADRARAVQRRAHRRARRRAEPSTRHPFRTTRTTLA